MTLGPFEPLEPFPPYVRPDEDGNAVQPAFETFREARAITVNPHGVPYLEEYCSFGYSRGVLKTGRCPVRGTPPFIEDKEAFAPVWTSPSIPEIDTSQWRVGAFSSVIGSISWLSSTLNVKCQSKPGPAEPLILPKPNWEVHFDSRSPFQFFYINRVQDGQLQHYTSNEPPPPPPDPDPNAPPVVWFPDPPPPKPAENFYIPANPDNRIPLLPTWDWGAYVGAASSFAWYFYVSWCAEWVQNGDDEVALEPLGPPPNLPPAPPMPARSPWPLDACPSN